MATLDEPFVVEKSELGKDLFKDGGVRLNHLVFRAAFVKDKALPRDMKNLMNAEHVRRQLFGQLLTAEAN